VAAKQLVGGAGLFQIDAAANRNDILGAGGLGQTPRQRATDESCAAGHQKSLHAAPTISGVRIGVTLKVSDS